MNQKKDYLAVFTIILLAITTIAGVLSINFENTREVVNQYGDSVTLYGYGIYSHDTLLQGVTSVGTDLSVLFVFIPMCIYTYIQYRNKSNSCNTLKLISMYAVIFYYAASISFGTAYNAFFLVYIALFTCSLFGMIRHITTLHWTTTISISKGMIAFLSISGVALIVAWLPDIIQALIYSRPLEIIGIYTTAVTYVLDMGIISPLCFVILYLLIKQKPEGTYVFAILCRLCFVIGIMMLFQTVVQMMANLNLPIVVVLTKSGSFFLLAFFARHFEKKIYLDGNKNEK